jgi:hypothetical protein
VTPGDVEFVQVLASMTVCTGGVATVLYVDERVARRRSPHTWLPSTREAAVLGTFLFSWPYGCPALLIHFVKSRWSLAGWGWGLLWAIVLFAVNAGVLVAIDSLAL